MAHRHQGSGNPNAKLTDEIVRKARWEYLHGGKTQKELAAKYGVSKVVMNLVINGRTWKHVR